MIVIGVDVHKHSLTAVAVDELGRTIAERTGQVEQELVEWAGSLSDARLWALEDCRHVTRALERTLQDQRERLVRVPSRPYAREVGCNRRPRDRSRRAPRTRARLSPSRRTDAARAEAAGRPPRRSR